MNDVCDHSQVALLARLLVCVSRAMGRNQVITLILMSAFILQSEIVSLLHSAWRSYIAFAACGWPIAGNIRRKNGNHDAAIDV